ncbi:hypothetical protein QEH59_14650 [Coraliomargarita sp. SDUM461004]|uniref:Uncharacterized protein n=1 Tax=Thalassobacterium sedimentorum TaxID=3041258 RepID=A0ABU1ALK4_9BACT|nr:hypothetical protein [Coraliomargarita sp. SDUM461004]MDQ8195671.1 hypothetical protein [Coraliomargarita sp. SDUM461004]
MNRRLTDSIEKKHLKQKLKTGQKVGAPVLNWVQKNPEFTKAVADKVPHLEVTASIVEQRSTIKRGARIKP